MRVPDRPTPARRMLQSRLKQLTPTGPLLAASRSLVQKRGGQPPCRCHRGGPLHATHHLTLKAGGQTRTVYVPRDLLGEVQAWVAAYQRLKGLMAQVSQLTLALVQGHARQRKRKRGRL